MGEVPTSSQDQPGVEAGSGTPPSEPANALEKKVDAIAQGVGILIALVTGGAVHADIPGLMRDLGLNANVSALTAPNGGPILRGS